MQMDN